jgi:hypothetical protein
MTGWTSMPKERSPEPREQEPEATRVDRFAIGHDAFQFTFDFWQSSDDGEPSAITRLKTSAPIAKDLSRTLTRSLEEYEQRFGEIPSDDDQT